DSIAFAYGVSRQQIMDLNNIVDPRIISVGQRLTITTPEPSADTREGGEGANAAEEPSSETEDDPTEVAAAPTEETADVLQGEVVVEESAPPPTPEPEPTQPLPTAPVVV